MQILHPCSGSIQQYCEQLADPERYRPAACPLCQVAEPLASHGFYQRTVVAETVEDLLPVRRYLCRCCWRTVSLLPEFLLPYLRFGVSVVARFLKARLGEGQTLKAAAQAAGLPHMPYQRGQHWVRRFRKQAPGLSVALAAVTTPRLAADFVSKALGMLEAVGWMAAHRFLFSQLRGHLLGWPLFLAPDGLGGKLSAAPLPPAP
jgi:Domain of unknown function (DUF6431)